MYSPLASVNSYVVAMGKQISGVLTAENILEWIVFLIWKGQFLQKKEKWY
jgi:hypothetical protein